MRWPATSSERQRAHAGQDRAEPAFGQRRRAAPAFLPVATISSRSVTNEFAELRYCARRLALASVE